MPVETPQPSVLYLPPGIFCTVEDRAYFADCVCGACRDPRREIAGIVIPSLDALSTGEISPVFDVVETLQPYGNALAVGEMRTNPRPAVFCAECYRGLTGQFLDTGRGYRLLDPEAL